MVLYIFSSLFHVGGINLLWFCNNPFCFCFIAFLLVLIHYLAVIHLLIILLLLSLGTLFLHIKQVCPYIFTTDLIRLLTSSLNGHYILSFLGGFYLITCHWRKHGSCLLCPCKSGSFLCNLREHSLQIFYNFTSLTTFESDWIEPNWVTNRISCTSQ